MSTIHSVDSNIIFGGHMVIDRRQDGVVTVSASSLGDCVSITVSEEDWLTLVREAGQEIARRHRAGVLAEIAAQPKELA